MLILQWLKTFSWLLRAFLFHLPIKEYVQAFILISSIEFILKQQKIISSKKSQDWIIKSFSKIENVCHEKFKTAKLENIKKRKLHKNVPSSLVSNAFWKG